MALKVKALAGGAAEIYIYGAIGGDWMGEGITAKDFSDQLKSLGNVKTIDVRVNSEGGDVFDGRTIHTLLKTHPAKICMYVDGIAASAASLIAMAGDTITMADGSFMMIHQAWTMAGGRAVDLRKTADLLDQVNESLVTTYAARTKIDSKKIRKMMDDETWMESSDALALGFCDCVSEPLRVAACVNNPSKFKNLPAALRPKRAAALSVIDGMKNPAPRR